MDQGHWEYQGRLMQPRHWDMPARFCNIYMPRIVGLKDFHVQGGQVQFFKAHIGLPPVLSAARGTHRDVSFCQFVVRDGKSFEVNDASNDERIPQHVVKEYNIQSYLGVPIKIDEKVMGSLCVLDTKKRQFSKDEHNSLNKLAELVNIRLNEITEIRRQTRLDLTEATLTPVINELSNSIKSL